MNPDRSGHFNPDVLAVPVTLHLVLFVNLRMLDFFSMCLNTCPDQGWCLLLMCNVSAGQWGSEEGKYAAG